MTPIQLKKLKSDSKTIKAVVSIGKNGLSKNTYETIRKHLKVHHLTKVKLLRSFLDSTDLSKKELAAKLAEETRSELVQLLGLTVTLYKR